MGSSPLLYSTLPDLSLTLPVFMMYHISHPPSHLQDARKITPATQDASPAPILFLYSTSIHIIPSHPSSDPIIIRFCHSYNPLQRKTKSKSRQRIIFGGFFGFRFQGLRMLLPVDGMEIVTTMHSFGGFVWCRWFL